ncbi:MAG: response regulator [Acidobacteriia bacterium]|nr:response regulator [Terriglobia bacterium]
MSAPRILVVDDDQDSRNLLSEFLGANGYAVAAVGDGTAAREELSRVEGYQVIVADLRMPRESGLELLRNLRRQESKHVIILMSSFISQGEKRQAKELGAHALLEKPFRLTDLLAAVQEAAAKKPIPISP